jgi:regulatory protein
MLARRDFARAELARKLSPHAVPGEDLAPLLDELEKMGALSETRFAEQLLRRYSTRHGPLKLKAALQRRGVAAEVAAVVLDAARAGEVASAVEVLRRKFPAPPRNREEWARQGRYLQNRGFGMEVIRKVLDAPANAGPD